MEIVRGQRLAWIFLLIGIAAAGPAAAQPGLEARMRAFRGAVEEGDVGRVAPFFPRRGTWTWVLTTHQDARGNQAGVWRFGAEQTPRAIREGGPVCESFALRFEARMVGTLIDRMMRDRRPWRRVPGNRFVPRGASNGSATFVQWRQEDDAWVVSAFGDERWQGPRALGIDRNLATRDRLPSEPLTMPIPADGPHAGRMRWFLEHEPIVFDDGLFLSYGPPRTLRPGDVTRIGSLDGVGIYEETGATGAAEVLYVPVGPGFEFQAYQGFGSPPCYDPASPPTPEG